jgi:hypothetical protein
MPDPPVLLRVIHLDQTVETATQDALLAVLRLCPAQARDRLLVVAQRLEAVRRAGVDLVVRSRDVVSSFEGVAGACRPRSRRTEQVPDSHDRTARRDRHRSLLSDENLVDGLAVPADPHAAAAFGIGYSRVPQSDSRVVAAGKDEGRGRGDERSSPDIVGMGGEGAQLGRSREVEKSDGGVRRGGQDLSSGTGRELGRVDRPASARGCSAFRPHTHHLHPDLLLVCTDCAQDCSAVDVKHLNEAALVSGDAELAVRPDLAARRRLFEPRDSLDDTVGLGRVDL